MFRTLIKLLKIPTGVSDSCPHRVYSPVRQVGYIHKNKQFRMARDKRQMRAWASALGVYQSDW